MSNPDSSASSDSPQVAESWETYWHGTGDAGAYSSGGVSHPAILNFWDEFFRTVRQDYNAPQIVDIGSGNGAVLERVLAIFDDQRPDFTCLDASAGAIKNIRNRFPGIQSIIADARSNGLASGSFDIVTSQFGVEYAGVEAIDEAARLVAPGGQIALLLHNQASSIYQECMDSRAAVIQLRDSGFIPYSMQMLSTGFEACRGADRAPYEAAAAKLAPAVQALEAIMTQYGEHVAGDTIARLYSDVDRIHRRMQHYDPAEVLDWLSRLDGELEAYAGRMSAMCTAAIDSEAFERICVGLRSCGYVTTRAEPLTVPNLDFPLAWVLVAAR